MKTTHALLGEHGAMHPLLDLIERTASTADLADLKTQARFLGASLSSHVDIEDELLRPAILSYPRSLHRVSPKVIEQSIERIVKRYRETNRLPQATEDFLYRRPPRLKGRTGGPIIPQGVDLLEGSIVAAVDLDSSTLCIQGPPGSGKTYTGAHMVVELLRTGKRVGVTSNSHRAICLLMNEAARVARAAHVALHAVKIGGEDEDHEELAEGIQWVTSASDVFKGGALPLLIGGTAWAFSRPEAEGALDYLFIDEAGQVSVANLLGMSPSTRNIILIGDQMQLSQPIKGPHPGESGCSTLEYLLQGHATIPEDFGIFLGETWRMHPDVCRFISGAVYEDRLKPKPITATRTLRYGAGQRLYVRKNAGIVFIPVEHVVVGNPALARTRCSTLEQMQLVNVFCRAVDAGARRAAIGCAPALNLVTKD